MSGKNIIKCIFFSLLGLCIGVGIAWCISLVNSTDKSVVKFSGGSMIEGEGFDSPEDAIRTYIESYGKTDISELYKCFAIESSVNNLTVENLLDYSEFYSYYSPAKLPIYGDESRRIAIEYRKSEVNKIIFSHYRVLMGWSENTKSLTIPLGEKSVQELIDENMPNNEYCISDGLVIDRILSGKDFQLEAYNSEHIREMREKMRLRNGAEEIQDVAVIFHTKQGYYIWISGASKYNGKWYLDNNAANLYLVIGLNTDDSGMVYLGKSFDEKAILNGIVESER